MHASRITPELVALRMDALADHYRRLAEEAQQASEGWVAELAQDWGHVAELVRQRTREGYRQAVQLLGLMRYRAHAREDHRLAVTCDNFATVIGWLSDAATR